MQMVDSGLTPRTQYVKATFKTTRLINAHSVEHIGAGVLDIKIQHRFGTLNGGFYEFFGLDQATIRIGGDYGITDWLMVGIGDITTKRVIPAILAEPRSVLYGVVSRDRDKGLRYAGRVWTDLAAALSDPEVDAVYVATRAFRCLPRRPSRIRPDEAGVA
jgi:hypothetical protein